MSTFNIGDRVEKINGSAWLGKVVGQYSTSLTPEGYAVESEREPGSVQIYPAKALRLATYRATAPACPRGCGQMGAYFGGWRCASCGIGGATAPAAGEQTEAQKDAAFLERMRANSESWQAYCAKSAAPAAQAEPLPDDVLEALELDPEKFRTEGGAINKGKLRAAILHPYNYLPEDHWLQARFSKPGGRPAQAEPLQAEARPLWDKNNPADGYCSDAESAARKASLQAELPAVGERPVAWWNGLRQSADPDDGSESFSLEEDTWHDIPLYAGTNPCNSPAAVEARAPQGLPLKQEPKYTVNAHAIVNRASGEEIPADEPVFIFRARDKLAVRALEDYALRCSDGQHYAAVRKRIKHFRAFASRHQDRMKIPDTAPVSASAQAGEGAEG